MAKVARCPFSAGDILPVEKDGFLRRLAPSRSLLPQNTVLKRAEFPQRPSHEDVDAFLAQDVECKFEITQTIRTGRKHYSQVVLGRFVGCQRLLCLEIFDERYFPACLELNYVEMDEQDRVLSRVTADDLVRRFGPSGLNLSRWECDEQYTKLSTVSYRARDKYANCVIV